MAVEKNQVIVFDWGNTLMAVDPAFSGPMVDWPVVKAVPGSQTALAQLHDHYHLVIGTNAKASNPQQIRAALKRVNLDEYIDEIYTMHELDGATKPNQEFYQRIERILGVPAEHIVMVGDDYLSDVCGASTAGWRSVWFNREYRLAPLLNPIYDDEVFALEDLPACLEHTTLPDLNTCRMWMIEQGMTANVLVHVQMVAALAYTLAVWLKAAGQQVNPLLAHRGGLLHDICKISAKSSGLNHGEAGELFLGERNQPVLAAIARRHMLFNLLDSSAPPQTWEERLVYYADKLIEKNQIVPIETRLQGLRQRYGIQEKIIANLNHRISALELDICALLNLTPFELVNRLQASFSIHYPNS